MAKTPVPLFLSLNLRFREEGGVCGKGHRDCARRRGVVLCQSFFEKNACQNSQKSRKNLVQCSKSAKGGKENVKIA